jgi:hypothetical protein
VRHVSVAIQPKRMMDVIVLATSRERMAIDVHFDRATHSGAND